MPVMRRQASGQFELPISASEAIDYFTPEGERSWAPGWDPIYPAGEVSETQGTVFTTAHDDVETVWVIERIDRGANTSAYSRITPGHHAGSVRVRCDDQPDDGCVVSVEYDITALSSDHTQVLDHYTEEAFKAMMNHWSEAVHLDL